MSEIAAEAIPEDALVIATAVGSFTPETRLLIGGELVEAASGRRFDNIDPATEAVLGEVADAGHDDVARAIAAARSAFDTTEWSTNHAFRKRCLDQLQHAMEGEREQMRAELVAEAGTPVSLTYTGQLDLPLDEAFRWPAANIDRFDWERQLPPRDAFGVLSRRLVVKEPHGVVAAIVPWNYPFEVTASKLGPVLATGNTVILKAAPDTPWNATRLGRLVAEQTDIPAGVVNVVTASDHLVAEDLLIDPRVDMISFTGSTAVGKRIMEVGGASFKRVFLELGGKSAMIVCDDADFAAVLPSVAGVCQHAGQGCSISTRILVPRSRYGEAVKIIVEAMKNVEVGDPADPAVVQGPQISARQRDRVMSYIRKGLAEGAELALGGGAPAHLARGFYVEPTVFINVSNSMTVAREEIFGPVAVVIPYEDDDDAVRIANDSAYGLAGAVYSASDDRAMAISRRIRAGALSVNGGIWYAPDAPYGGYKSSGIGRQNGLEGFEIYLETKVIAAAG